MTYTVYTNYWINRRDDVKKEHGSYSTEDEAISAIKTWWELHKENYTEVEELRTNSGALEIHYGDDNYYYRIEERQISQPLPPRAYKLRPQGEIDRLRQQYQLDDETFLFDELAEPYRDRLVLTMSDPVKAKEFVYTHNGQPIVQLARYRR